MIGLSSKLESLKSILSEMGSVLIAYSGGTDSTFLLKVASSVLGDRVLAVTASSETYPEKTFNVAKILFQTKEFFLYDTHRLALDQRQKAGLQH